MTGHALEEDRSSQTRDAVTLRWRIVLVLLIATLATRHAIMLTRGLPFIVRHLTIDEAGCLHAGQCGMHIGVPQRLVHLAKSTRAVR